MRIGFDAKRAFLNNTGLGNYSRTLINSLAKDFPQQQYYLFTPKLAERYQPLSAIKIVTPGKTLNKTFSSAWRSKWVIKDLQKYEIDLYHGLSHEIPLGIQHTNIKTVVTIHDLIYERYPEQFSKIDVMIYRKKFSYACRHADRVIAISEQTKADIIDFFKTPEEKIEVIYQSCDLIFNNKYSPEELQRIKQQYQLPERFFLYVGSVTERKNLLGIVKALNLLKQQLAIPLVVLGNGQKYKEKVKAYLKNNNLQKQVLWLSEKEEVPHHIFPAIYQQAEALLYPSLFEGFGIPILEAFRSRIPVITSKGSCFAETGGEGALYINALNPEELAEAMLKITKDKALKASLIEKGWQHAQQFSPEKSAKQVMEVYESLIV